MVKKKKKKPKVEEKKATPVKQQDGAELSTVIDPVGKFNLNSMDERTLRGTFKDLREAATHAGVALELNVSRTDDEATVRTKLKKSLRKFQTPEAMLALARINPDKLIPREGEECKGVFVNLNSAACVGCSSRDECIRLYLQNVPENFKKFNAAMADADVTGQMVQAVSSEKTAAAIKEIAGKVKAETGKAKPSKFTSAPLLYEASRRIGVLEWEKGKNPYKKSHEAHDLVQEIYDRNPKTLLDLRTIVEEHIEFKGSSKAQDRKFMEVVVGLLDDPPIIGLRAKSKS